MPTFTDFSLLFNASRNAFPCDKKGSLFKRLKFLFRSWSDRKFNLAWLSLLQKDPFLKRLAKSDYRMYRKFYRPYLSSSWDRVTAMAAVCANYTYLQQWQILTAKE